MVYHAGRDHEAGIEGAACYAAKGVPCSYKPLMSASASQNWSIAWVYRTIIKPVPEFVEAVIDQIFRSSEVEPRINCSLISLHFRIQLLLFHWNVYPLAPGGIAHVHS